MRKRFEGKAKAIPTAQEAETDNEPVLEDEEPSFEEEVSKDEVAAKPSEVGVRFTSLRPRFRRTSENDMKSTAIAMRL